MRVQGSWALGLLIKWKLRGLEGLNRDYVGVL